MSNQIADMRTIAAKKAIRETMEEEVWDFLNCRAENILLAITHLDMNKDDATVFVDDIISNIHAEYDKHRENARKHGL